MQCMRLKSVFSNHSQRLASLILFMVGICLLTLTFSTTAKAATGVIGDDAHVLDTAAIRPTSDALSFKVNIFTTNIFKGSTSDFDTATQQLTSQESYAISQPCDPTTQVGCDLYQNDGLNIPDFSSPTVVAGTPIPSASNPAASIEVRNDDPSASVEVAIDVKDRHIAIFAGDNITLPSNHYQQAIDSFASTMHQTRDNYTQALIAALNSLQSAADRFWNGVSHALPFVFIGIVIIAAFLLSLVFRGNNSYRTNGYQHNNWDSGSWGGGGGGNSGGGNSGGGTGGGGASGNF
jgi:hypothetical protein